MTQTTTSCCSPPCSLASCGGGSSPTASSPAAPRAARRPAARPSASARSCATRCSSTTTGTRSCRTPTRPASPRPRPTSTPSAIARSTRRYSYITSKASSDAFFSDSQFIGFGLSYKRTGELELRLTQAFPGSPAADAGLDRGHYLVSVGGKPVADLIRTRRDRDDLRPGAGRLLDRDRVAGAERPASGARRSPSAWSRSRPCRRPR